MTRKEALKQIAQRCMEGGGNRLAYDAVNLFDRPDLPIMTAFEDHSLDAVAELEAELLPDNLRMEIVSFDGRFQVYYAPIIHQPFESFHTKFCDTEPLARLAALCLALSEMEAE